MIVHVHRELQLIAIELDRLSMSVTMYRMDVIGRAPSSRRASYSRRSRTRSRTNASAGRTRKLFCCIAYCLSAAGGFPSGAGGGSGAGVVPRSSDADAQSPAQSLVPLTVPTSLQPIGARGLTCFTG